MVQADKAEFETVLKDELDLLDKLRSGAPGNPGGSIYERARRSNLTGLAFSGGGIRSATFNLGVIQALARYGLLSKFDYLSTVSGGGYIGGWLSALLHRKAAQQGRVDEEGVRTFEADLKPHPDHSGLDDTVGFKAVEHRAVRYLRGYSNYLSPRIGLSGDALAAVSIFLRNFALIQLTLISLVASVLLLAQLIGAMSMDIAQKAWPLVGGVLALAVAIFFAGWLSAERGTRATKPASASRAVIMAVIGPCALAAWWICLAIGTPSGAMRLGEQSATKDAYWWWMLAGAIGYGLAWTAGYVAALIKRRRAMHKTKDKPDAPAFGVTHVAAAIFSGALLGLLLYASVRHVAVMAEIEPWHVVAFGPPLFFVGLSFIVTVHIAAARRAFGEQEREWLARLGGLVLWCIATWTLLFALVLYATPAVQWLSAKTVSAIGAVWAGGSGLGVWFGRDPATGGKKDGLSWKNVVAWKEVIAKIAPWLFIAGLCVIIAHALHVVLTDVIVAGGHVRLVDAPFRDAANSALRELKQLHWPTILSVLLGTGALFAVLAWRIDINLFSLHAFYRYRLTRAYLGASRAGERNPNPFTGFDRADDLFLRELDNQRPIHIINTAINMTGGDDLAWQTRRAASFAFTPRWAGFETRSSQGIRLGTYRPTARYAGGRLLGSVIAVSGAAASPNMGYHTSSGVAALMTAFNLRLGRWCGNPVRDKVWAMTSPCFAARPIFAELFGSATAQADWINLTDGGHFDNLGVYELVRRRCQVIVVVDAGCDPKYQFEDLANTLRKCWTDLGVNIRFEQFEPMYRHQHGRYREVHGVVGRIEYDKDGPHGVIIYLKSSLTGDEWPDIRQYADTHKDFPHQTTADQFFDENQFEAYRHLGYKVVAKMVGTLQSYLGTGSGQPATSGAA